MQNLNVNITPDNYPQSLYYSQNDVGREFKINITDFTIPVGATVKIQATKPSGFGFSVAGAVSGNSVTFETTDEMTDEAGRFPAELVIESGAVVIGTANFLMVGEMNPHPEGTTDGSQGTIIPELTLLVERVEAAASSVLDMQVVAQTLPAGSQASYSYDEDLNKATFGIPEGQAGAGAAGVVASAYSAAKTYKVGDYVLYNSNLYRCTTAITTAEAWTAAHWTQIVLADDVTDLKTDFNDFEKIIFKETISKPALNGYWDASDGHFSVSTSLSSSDKIKVREGMIISATNISQSTQFYWICWNNGAYVRYVAGRENLTIPSDVDEVAIDYDASVGVANISIDIFYPFNFDENANSLLLGGKYTIRPLLNGYWNVTTGTWSINGATINATPIFPIYEGMELEINNMSHEVTEYYWVFYDENKNFLSFIPNAYGVTVPNKARYVAFDYPKSTTLTKIEFLITKGVIEAIESTKPLHNGFLVTAGDSFTDGAAISSQYPDITKRPTYGYLVANKNSMGFLNQGHSGSTMCDISVDGVSRDGYCTSRVLQIPNQVTHITLWFGWNDEAYGVNSLKDIYCQTEYSKYYSQCTAEEKAVVDAYQDWETAFIGSVDSTDKKTWYGAWNYTLDYILQNYADIKIGVVIPFLNSDTLSTAMRTALVNICKRFGVPYIDSQDSNAMPTNGHSTDLSSAMETLYRNARTTDGLHYNVKGYEMIQNAFEQWLYRI